ncbi:MAG: YigZ family protein, partial [Gemmatimonadetes bacterium]|nr:YigZ family protein [Gemmatimonadota bacterium]
MTRYPIPAGRHRAEQVIDRSRFVATLDRAATPDEAHEVLRAVAAEFDDATHHALAFVAGPPGSTTHVGMSDAGEPHGTAGRPMLTVLLHGGVGDIVAVCTRWYGGTKLGTGGLARAYGGTVQLALATLPRSEKVELVALAHHRLPARDRGATAHGGARSAHRCAGVRRGGALRRAAARQPGRAVRTGGAQRHARHRPARLPGLVMRRFVVRALQLVVVLLCGAVVATWAPDLTVAELAPRWAPPPSTFRPVLDLSVHLRDEGPRDDTLPVLLLHGSASSLHTWDGWAVSLARARRVIRIDLPAYGLTGPFPDGRYEVAHYLRFLQATLDSLRVPRAIVVGNSFGGELAWSLAVTAPARVAGLVLVDAAGLPRTSISVPIGFRLARIPGFGPILERVLPRAIVASSVRNTYGDPARVADTIVDRYYAMVRRAGNRAAIPLRFAATTDSSLISRLRTLTVPTLIVWGLRDRLIPPDHGEQFHAAITGSTLVTFDDLGHVPMEEDPARTLVPVR